MMLRATVWAQIWFRSGRAFSTKNAVHEFQLFSVVCSSSASLSGSVHYRRETKKTEGPKTKRDEQTRPGVSKNYFFFHRGSSASLSRVFRKSLAVWRNCNSCTFRGFADKFMKDHRMVHLGRGIWRPCSSFKNLAVNLFRGYFRKSYADYSPAYWNSSDDSWKHN